MRCFKSCAVNGLLSIACFFGSILNSLAQSATPAIEAAVQGPVVTQNNQGRFQVDIHSPNANGLSHNQYTQFNVNAAGVALNNQVNAQIILNEVIGNQASQLNGAIEVLGQRADVIIANPHGLTCNGCGFINTRRGVLITGVPELISGELNFQVSQGKINIGDQGLINYRARQIDPTHIDLIANHVSINGKIHDAETGQLEVLPAGKINVVAGRQQVALKQSQSQAVADVIVKKTSSTSDTTEAGLIDIGQLGGMYGQRIYLKNTEQGTGVTSRGVIHATDDLVISANGRIENKGLIEALGPINLTASTLLNRGVIRAEKDITANVSQISNVGDFVSTDGDIRFYRIHTLINGGLGKQASLMASKGVTMQFEQGQLENNALSVIYAKNNAIQIDGLLDKSDKIAFRNLGTLSAATNIQLFADPQSSQTATFNNQDGMILYNTTNGELSLGWNCTGASSIVSCLDNKKKQGGEIFIDNGIPLTSLFALSTENISPPEKTEQGRTLVHIKKPTQTGLSHNKVKQFDVPMSGLIINNYNGVAKRFTLAHQNQKGEADAFWGRNPHLGTAANGSEGPASLILFEVEDRKSNLHGMIEIAGTAADFVLANRLGIECHGCGAINSPKWTLTTGLPQFSVREGNTKSLTHFQVNEGAIVIGADGLSAYQAEIAPQVNLLAKNMQVEGEVKGLKGFGAHSQVVPLERLNILSGAYTIPYASLNAIEMVDSQSFSANDSTQLATLNLYESSWLFAKSLSLANVSSTGQIKNAGTMDVMNRLVINSQGNLQLAGKTTVGGEAKFNAANLETFGKLKVHQGLEMVARGNIDNRGGEILLDGNYSLKATATGAINNKNGLIVSKGNLFLTAQGIDNTKGVLSAEKKININASTQLLNNTDGVIQAQQGIQIQAQGLENKDGVIRNHGAVCTSTTTSDTAAVCSVDINVTADVNNQNSSSTQQNTAITKGIINNTLGDVKIAARTLNNRGMIDGRNVAITVKDQLFNTAWIQSYGNLTLEGDVSKHSSINNEQYGKMIAQGNLFVRKINNFQNVGLIETHTNFSLENLRGNDITALSNGNGNTFDNRGIIRAKQNIAMAIDFFSNLSGARVLSEQGNVSIDSYLFKNDVNAYIQSQIGLTVIAQEKITNKGWLQNKGVGLTQLNTKDLINQTTNVGSIVSGGEISSKEGAIDFNIERDFENTGLISAGSTTQASNLRFKKAWTQRGTIQATNDLSLLVDGVDNQISNQGVLLSHQGNLLIQNRSGQFSNTKEIYANSGNVDIAAQFIKNEGLIRAAKVATLDAHRFENSSFGFLLGLGGVKVTVTNDAKVGNQTTGYAIRNQGAIYAGDKADVALILNVSEHAEATLSNEKGSKIQAGRSIVLGRDCNLDSQGQCQKMLWQSNSSPGWAYIYNDRGIVESRGYEEDGQKKGGNIFVFSDRFYNILTDVIWGEKYDVSPDRRAKIVTHSVNGWKQATSRTEYWERDWKKNIDFAMPVDATDSAAFIASGSLNIYMQEGKNLGGILAARGQFKLASLYADQYAGSQFINQVAEKGTYFYKDSWSKKITCESYPVIGCVSSKEVNNSSFTLAMQSPSLEKSIGGVLQGGSGSTINIWRFIGHRNINPFAQSFNTHIAQQAAQPSSNGIFDALPTSPYGQFVVNRDADNASNTQSQTLVQSNPLYQSGNVQPPLDSRFLTNSLFSQNANKKTMWANHLRLGDGLYEQYLISKQMLAYTGRAWLGESSVDNETQYRNLMTNALAYANLQQSEQDYDLGKPLNLEQQNSLTNNMVWLIKRDVAGHKDVLVPQLYLTKNERANSFGGKIVGSGLTMNLQQLDNGGTIDVTGDLKIHASGAVKNQGTIKGKTVDIQAQTVTNNAVVKRYGDEKNYEDKVEQVALIQATAGNVTVKTSGNYVQQGGSVVASGDIDIEAEGEIKIASLALEKRTTTTSRDKNGDDQASQNEKGKASGFFEIFSTTHEEQETNTQSPLLASVKSGGNVRLKGKEGITLVGTEIDVADKIQYESPKKVDFQGLLLQSSLKTVKTTMGLGLSASAGKGDASTGISWSTTATTTNQQAKQYIANAISAQQVEVVSDEVDLGAAGFAGKTQNVSGKRSRIDIEAKKILTTKYRDQETYDTQTVITEISLALNANMPIAKLIQDVLTPLKNQGNKKAEEYIALLTETEKIKTIKTQAETYQKTLTGLMGELKQLGLSSTLNTKLNTYTNLLHRLEGQCDTYVDPASIDSALAAGRELLASTEQGSDAYTKINTQLTQLEALKTWSATQVPPSQQSVTYAAIVKGLETVGNDVSLFFQDYASAELKLALNVRKDNETVGEKKDNIVTLAADEIALKQTEGDLFLQGVKIRSMASASQSNSATASNTESTALQNGQISLTALNGNIRVVAAEREVEEDRNGTQGGGSLGGGASLDKGGAGASIDLGVTGGTSEARVRQKNYKNSSIAGHTVTIRSGKSHYLDGATITAHLFKPEVGEHFVITSKQDTKESESGSRGVGVTVGAGVSTTAAIQPSGNANINLGSNKESAAITAEQSGVIANQINGEVKQDLRLIGGHLLVLEEDQNKKGLLKIGGKIEANLLKDFISKSGHQTSVGGGVSRSGMITGNATVNLGDKLDYEAHQFATIVAPLAKLDGAALMIASLLPKPNENMQKMMEVIRADYHDGIDIGLTLGKVSKGLGRKWNKSSLGNNAGPFPTKDEDVDTQARRNPSEKDQSQAVKPKKDAWDDSAPCCFAPGTLVATPQGYRAIETIKVGDLVWTKHDSNQGDVFAAPVTAIHIRDDQAIYRLRLQRETTQGIKEESLLVTASHPFYLIDKGFVPAIALQAGDVLLSRQDQIKNTTTVLAIELVQADGVTHNLTVAEGHTFFVGEFETWVHNTGPCVNKNALEVQEKLKRDINTALDVSKKKIQAAGDAIKKARDLDEKIAKQEKIKDAAWDRYFEFEYIEGVDVISSKKKQAEDEHKRHSDTVAKHLNPNDGISSLARQLKNNYFGFDENLVIGTPAWEEAIQNKIDTELPKTTEPSCLSCSAAGRLQQAFSEYKQAKEASARFQAEVAQWQAKDDARQEAKLEWDSAKEMLSSLATERDQSKESAKGHLDEAEDADKTFKTSFKKAKAYQDAAPMEQGSGDAAVPTWEANANRLRGKVPNSNSQTEAKQSLVDAQKEFQALRKKADQEIPHTDKDYVNYKQKPELPAQSEQTGAQKWLIAELGQLNEEMSTAMVGLVQRYRQHQAEDNPKTEWAQDVGMQQLRSFFEKQHKQAKDKLANFDKQNKNTLAGLFEYEAFLTATVRRQEIEEKLAFFSTCLDDILKITQQKMSSVDTILQEKMPPAAEESSSEKQNDNDATVPKLTSAASSVLEDGQSAIDFMSPQVRQIGEKVEKRTVADEAGIQALLQQVEEYQVALKEWAKKIENAKGLNKKSKDEVTQKMRGMIKLLMENKAALQSRLKNVQQQARDQLEPGLMNRILDTAKTGRSQDENELIKLTQETMIDGKPIKISSENVISIKPIGSLVERIDAAVKRLRPELTDYKKILSPTVFLEPGNAAAGLHHVLVRHGSQFEQAGVKADDVPKLIMDAITHGQIVDFQGPDVGRPIFEVSFNGQPLRLSIVIGQNGFIVASNIVSTVQSGATVPGAGTSLER